MISFPYYLILHILSYIMYIMLYIYTNTYVIYRYRYPGASQPLFGLLFSGVRLEVCVSSYMSTTSHRRSPITGGFDRMAHQMAGSKGNTVDQQFILIDG